MFEELIKDVTATSRAEEGCIDYHWYQLRDNVNHL